MITQYALCFLCVVIGLGYDIQVLRRGYTNEQLTVFELILPFIVGFNAYQHGGYLSVIFSSMFVNRFVQKTKNTVNPRLKKIKKAKW